MATNLPVLATIATCECGCGQPVSINERNSRSKGYVRGLPKRFVLGHSNKGRGAYTRYRTTNVNGVTKFDHVLIAEKALGKSLPDGAEVHHFDGVRNNNDHSNLVICQDHKYHCLLHVRQRVRDAGGDPNSQRICCTCKKLTLISELVGGKATRPCHACHRARVRATKVRRQERTVLSGLR